jgi:RNA dependent RNA polymerase
VPAAYQMQFMGSKGMISVDHSLEGLAIGFRPSMVKVLTPETVRDSQNVLKLIRLLVLLNLLLLFLRHLNYCFFLNYFCLS